jgi:hypothetical protein
MSAAMAYQSSVPTVSAWAGEFEALRAQIALRFQRAEPRRRALSYLRGLLSHAECKNVW